MQLFQELVHYENPVLNSIHRGKVQALHAVGNLVCRLREARIANRRRNPRLQRFLRYDLFAFL